MPSRVVCFVCGSLGGEYQLRSRSYEGCAFFPFLEHHDPPKGSRIPGPDGIVDSCRVCYAFLTQQWETYERTNTPAIKRLYWLKRLDDGQFTGAEMKLQGEYMAQVMGLQYQPSCGDSCAPGSPDSRDGSGTGAEADVGLGRRSQAPDDGDRVLDLSVPVKSDMAQISNRSTPAGPREATRMKPQLDDFSVICYICGEDNEGVAAKCISSVPHGANKPFFPFLTKLTPPKGAAQLNGQGICQVCDRCFSSLCHQWLTYEHHGTPNSARIFKVNAQFFSNDCSIALGLAPDALSASGEVCYLCSRSWASSKVCSLYTTPTSARPDHMYFPFIRELRRPHGARPLNPDGSVLVCVSCYSNLQDQWQRYEAEKVPFLQRRYSLLPPSSSASSMTSLSLKSFADSDLNCDPGMLKIEGVAKSVTQPLAIEISKSATFAKTAGQSLPSGPTSYSSAALIAASAGSHQTTTQESSRHHAAEPKAHSSSTILSIPHPLQQAGERPKKVCFLCGQKCLLSKAQILYSYPVRHETKSSGGQCQTIPFFPFLASQPPAPGSEPMAEEGTVISCSYCFYSLLNQWRDFEESKGVTDRNRWLRKYTLNEFVCYVCGMMVPRKKMRTLEVHKFLFLREHKAPPNALVMWGGEGVGACGSCHYSLSHQFTEFERLGLPMELRKYNWTVQHHTEENSNDHDSNHGMSSAAINEDSNLSVADGADDSNHSSAPSSKPVFSLVSPASNVGKPSLKSALALPQSRMSPSNGLTSSSHSLSLSTSRSAGFAAALRSLAHQIKEPFDDANENSLTSPTNHNSRSNTPKRSQASLLLPSHSATSSFTSPPVVTVAPTQTSVFQGVTSFSLGQERSHMSTFEPWSKPEPDLPSLSTADGELIGKDLLLSRTSARAPAPRSVSAGGVPVTSQLLYARNFPAFRPEEEELLRHGLALPYGMDAASYAAAASAYHPALLQQQQAAFAQGSLRLGDSLLLDQYRMLQSPYLPFPAAAGLISPHSLGMGMHSVLAAAAQHYPPALFPQHYPYLSLGQPMMDPHAAAQTVAMERSWLDAEKARDKRDREKSRHQQHAHEKDVNHRVADAREHPDLIKKEDNSSSEAFAHASLDRKSTPSVPICLSSHSPEQMSRQFSESHNGHPSSRPSSSMSVTSGRRPASKRSPGVGGPMTETSLEKSSQPSLSLGGSHASLKSHLSILPSPGLTFKPYEKLYESSQHSSRPVLDQRHLHEESNLPPWIRSSSSNNTHDKNKNSDFTPLFRPFDDHKDSGEFTSAQTAHSTQRQWSLDNSSPMPPIHFTEPNTNRLALDSPDGSNDAHMRTSPLLSLNKDTTLVPNNTAVKESEICLNDRIKRFDFKSLAHECTSSSVHCQPGLISCDLLPAPAEAKHSLSKLDFEAARARERREKGQDTDSDTEKDKQERMRVRLTMVGRATPIPLDTSPPKMEFLENLGLTSWKRKKELNRQKETRRRRLLRLSSVSPIQHEADCTLELPGDSIKSLRHHSTHSLPPQVEAISADDEGNVIDLGEKSEFVARLGLMSVHENHSVAVPTAKRKFGEAETPFENLPQGKVTPGTSEQAACCPHDGSVSKLHDSIVPDSERPTQRHDASNKTLAHPGTAQHQGLPRLLGSGDHHQPVAAAGHNLIDPRALSPSTACLMSSRKAFRLPEHQDFTWPGVETVLESYHRHREEELAEVHILRERCRQLQMNHQNLAQVAHRVNSHMTYLMEERQRLLEERVRYQESINHLKQTFSHLK